MTPSAPRKLAGASVLVNGEAVPILYASPGQINAIAPMMLDGSNARVEIASAGMSSGPIEIPVQPRTPGILTVSVQGSVLTIWATGLGAPPIAPVVEINGVGATVTSAALVPGWTGLYRIDVLLPGGVMSPLSIALRE